MMKKTLLRLLKPLRELLKEEMRIGDRMIAVLKKEAEDGLREDR